MSRIDAWRGDAFPLSSWTDDVDPGVDTAILIAEQPVSVIVRRAGVDLDAQTVRIDALRQPRTIETEAGIVGTAEALVIGYRGHPTITDTDLQLGDRFTADGKTYEIAGLLPSLDDALHALARIRD